MTRKLRKILSLEERSQVIQMFNEFSSLSKLKQGVPKIIAKRFNISIIYVRKLYKRFLLKPEDIFKNERFGRGKKDRMKK